MELQSQCTCTGLLYCHLLAVEVFYYMAVNCYMKIILPDYAFIHAVAFTPSVPRTRGHLLLCSLIDMHGKIRGLKVVVFVYYQTKFLLLWQSALSWADRRQHPGVTAHRLPTVPHFSQIHLFQLNVKCVIFGQLVGSTLTYRTAVSLATQVRLTTWGSVSSFIMSRFTLKQS